MSLVETCIEQDCLLESDFLKVWSDRVRLPDGSEAVREYIKHPGAAIVIAETRPGVLLFERQFRYPVGRVCLELPAGKLDPAETPLVCAQRELLEETGYQAQQWQHLGVLHPCIGYSDERIEIFLAQSLSFVGQRLDQGEFLEVFEMSLQEADEAVFDGRITDAKTVTCLYWARKFLTLKTV